jgi:multimeric flavodoxin WrbA
MKKKVLILSTSLRKNSNSEILAGEFAKGAKKAGHEVEQISLKDKEINFCKGCLVCQTTKHCVMQDDAEVIAQKMIAADVLVFATPIYYYEMSGQMKTMLDRTNPLFTADYAFREIYLLATAADLDQSAINGAIHGLKGWLDCFDKTELKGVLLGTGVTKAAEISGTPILPKAYEMGETI